MKRNSPSIVLVSCPYNDKDYMTRDDMAIDDLGLGYLYVALKDRGYSVTLLDSLRPTPSFNSPYHELEDHILEIKPDYIGFSDSLITFQSSLKLSRSLKKKLPESVIIYGDIHASIYNREILQNESHIDYIICGDGDRSLPDLIEALENDKEVSKIPGLTYRYQDKIKENLPDFNYDLNRLPFPYRPSLKEPMIDRNAYYNIIGSRGCPGHCTYCTVSSFLNRHRRFGIERWRSRSAKNIFLEMKDLYHQGIRNFLFYDDNWIGIREVGLERVVSLCEMIIESGMDDISFFAAARPDSLLPEDIDKILIMKQAGLHAISFGLEAACPKQLKFFGKSYDPGPVRELVPLLLDNGIVVRTGYIMFYPYSTFESIRQNADFLSDLGLSYMFSAYSTKLMPLSNLAIEKKLNNDGLMIHPTTYKGPGLCKIDNWRLSELQQFLFLTIHSEQNTIDIILLAGTKASKRSKISLSHFREYRAVISRMGDASATLFASCADAFESASNVTDAIRSCYPFVDKWLNCIKTERIWLQKKYHLK